MGRPSLAPGTHGKITTREDPDGGWRARTLFRDFDGERREISRWARSRAEAERLIALAVRDRSAPSSGTIHAGTRVRELAEAWTTQLDDADLAEGSKRLYRFAVESYVTPALGGLRLRELSVQTLDRMLIVVRRRHGAGAAKAARSVLSGMLGYAVRYGALSSNLARDTSPITRKAAKPIRALTLDETAELLTGLERLERARDLDLPDLVAWMLGTGMRIGEACAVRAEVIDSGRVTVNSTVVRRPKPVGLVIQPRPKSAAGHRILTLSPSLLAMLERRAATVGLRGPQGVMFCSPRGHLRDPNNTTGDLREVLDELGFDWVTSHVFRKTVATRLDEAGFTVREVADILGHEKPSLTQDVYMGRKVVSDRMATALDGPVIAPRKAGSESVYGE